LPTSLFMYSFIHSFLWYCSLKSVPCDHQLGAPPLENIAQLKKLVFEIILTFAQERFKLWFSIFISSWNYRNAPLAKCIFDLAKSLYGDNIGAKYHWKSRFRYVCLSPGFASLWHRKKKKKNSRSLWYWWVGTTRFPDL
jgi:hypothetical protein